MEVGQLILAQQQVSGRLDKLERNFDSTSKSANNTEKSFFSLSKVAGALTTALSVKAIADYAESWTVLNNKLVNAIKTGETLAEVNQRVFDIAQNSRSSLDSIATLYSRLERAMRSTGMSGAELGDITSTISKAMTISGATASESAGALVQLSQALASGVLRGQEFNSMSEQAPVLMKGLADSLGVGTGQLRAMASEGKLTTDVLITAFKQMAPTIEAEFAKTTATIGQSMQIATNNVTKFVGESATVKSSVSVFNGVLVTLSENLDAVTVALGSAASVMLGKYLNSIGNSSKAVIEKVAANSKAAISELELAKDVLFRANAEDKATASASAKAKSDLAAADAAVATAKANVIAMETAVERGNAAMLLSEKTIAQTMTEIEYVKSVEASSRANIRSATTAEARAVAEDYLQASIKSRGALEAKLAAEQMALDAKRQGAVDRLIMADDALTAAQSNRAAAATAASTAEAKQAVTTNAVVVATERFTLATAAATVAARAKQVAISALSSVYSLLGGPGGVIMLAAAAIYYWYQKTEEAKAEAVKFANSLDGVIEKMNQMSATQLRGTMAEAAKSIETQKDAVSDLDGELKKLNDSLSVQLARRNALDAIGDTGTDEYSKVLGRVAEAENAVAIKSAELESAKGRLSGTQKNLDIITQQYLVTMQNNITATDSAISRGGVLAGVQNAVAHAFSLSADAVAGYNGQVNLMKPLSDKSKVLIKAAERRVALAKAEGAEKAKLQAQYAAEDAGETDDRVIQRTQDLAIEEYNLGEAKKNTKKETAAATKEETAAEAAEKRRVKSLQDLSNEMAVAELKTKGLNREAAQLAAVQDLGTGASQQQIQQATQQAGQIFDIQQRMADKKAAIDADSVAKAEQQRKLDLSQLNRQLAAGDISFEQSQQRRAQISADYSRAIAEASAASAVMPQQQNAALVDPVQALANENAQKLALIQKFEEDKTLTEQQALALRNAANTQYEQARLAAQWEIWRNQSQSNQYLASSIDALGQRTTNMLTGLLTGTQSAEEAMKNLAATIIQEGVNALVQMGMQQVKNMIMGQAAATTALAATAAQATAAAAAWAPAAVSASIATMGGASTVGTTAYGTALAASKGLAMAGARKNGGPVSAGEMYRVGEGGAPEIYQAGTGKQYMIPGDNGKVISNKDMQGGSGGAGTVVQQEIHFHIETTNGIDDATMQKMAAMMKTVSLNTIKDQQRPNGLLRK
ncbi:tape measure protein [Yersinia mollaretii]|uniref:tape measure protein n=1 Tax=Yersinia mollaretii TaxID=33060 RepID=UPI00211ED4C4|nr:tape measure protein [Yersinia mollaretii]MDA5527106.1 tape measure protein [Yersinia mollaretii]MDR7875710.1 tape measure protein [Yersinia mollaretii]WQC77061.1 tape measure protein [Yersinia mollaretii]